VLYFGLIFLALFLFFLCIKWFLSAEPHQVAKALKRLFIVLVGLGVLLLVLTGKIIPVVSVFIALLPLIVPVVIKMRSKKYQQNASHDRRSRARGAKMTREEAYEILGLKPGASRTEILQAHRRLILKVHPDQGGAQPILQRN